MKWGLFHQKFNYRGHMSVKNYAFTTMLVIGLTGCEAVLDDMNAMSGKTALSQPPSKSEIASARELNSPIAISAIHAERNYADGLNVSITFKNIDNDRTIKYATFKAVLKNNVNDLVTGKISNRDYVLLKSVGPIQPNEVNWGGLKEWTNVFYNSNASKIEIVSMDIEFMNGDIVSNLDVIGIEGGLGHVTSKY
jgi:hypothetical protein